MKTTTKTKDPLKVAKFAIEKFSNTLFPDQMRVRKGILEVRKSYFYRHGQTAEGWAARVELALREVGLHGYTVKGFDDYANWPKTSYFTAEVTYTA